MPATKEKSPAGSLVELVAIVAVALGLALGIQALLVKPYQIPSKSMVPTLIVGQRVLVNRIGERFTEPRVGDVIVFHPPAAATGDQAGFSGIDSECGAEPREGAACAKPVSRRSNDNFIKRVVAGPGDTLAVVDGHVVRNGKRQAEPFIQERCDGGGSANFPEAIRIPAGHWFMMGDNRECSEDSRFWGPVPAKWIIGGAFATYWPPKRVGLL
ncbi:MAG: signal peptidase I [Actinomycetota bacterium]|nr:signal peptidase I [Actinomycetota bacterium]